MTGNDVAATLALLDPDGTLRLPTSKKGEATVASPSPSSFDGDRPPLKKRISRARKHLARIPGAIQGNNGSKPTLYAARVLVRGYLLDAGTALGLMLTDYNPRCEPEWSQKELEHKIHDAETKPFHKPMGWCLAEKPRTAAPSAPATASPGSEPVGHPATPEVSKPGLPSIVQQPAQLRDVVDAAIAAVVSMNKPLATFIHGDSLVRIDSANNGTVKTLSKAQLRLLLSHSANWVNESTTKEGETTTKPTFPKSEVVESILDHTSWPGLPRLTALADVPVITAESGLLTKPGYDPDSGVYLLPGGYADVPSVSPEPMPHIAKKALNLILEDLLGDFPFADDSSRANVLALFLLPFVRGLINGPTPLHHIDAPQEGTGKSLPIQTWGHVTLGHEPKALGEVTRPDDWQKLILAELLSAPRAVFLDNLNHTLDSGSLASALTSGVVGGRLLGYSRVVSAPVNCAWVSSGNNVSMSREMARRTVYIRLDARCDTAWKGRKFKHKLPQWAKLNRGELVWACLTLCQSWVAAGKPPGRALVGGFEEWSAVMDGILSHHGITDLVSNSEAFRSMAVESNDDWRAFVPMWWSRYEDQKVTAGDLAQLADDKDLFVNLLDDCKSSRSRGHKMGLELKRVMNRVFGDIRIEFAGKNRRTQALYNLVNLNPDSPVDGDGDILEL